jgi:hypothetical protein
MGLAFSTAISRKTYAEITDTATGQHRKFLTQWLTNYNMLVFDQLAAPQLLRHLVNNKRLSDPMATNTG